jgi:hypothetical protein
MPERIEKFFVALPVTVYSENNSVPDYNKDILAPVNFLAVTTATHIFVFNGRAYLTVAYSALKKPFGRMDGVLQARHGSPRMPLTFR